MCAAEDLGRPLHILWRQEALFRGAFTEFFTLSPEQAAWITIVPIEQPPRGEVKCVTQEDWNLVAASSEAKANANASPVSIASYSHFYTADPARWLRHLRSLQPSAEIRARLAVYRTRLPATYVGVHIRRTDSIPAIEQSPTEAFLTKLRTYPETTQLFVASDDDTERAALRAAFPGRVYTVATQLERTSAEGCVQGWIELLLLAESTELVGSFYSSFSEIAAAYGGCPLILARNT
jgi:hypothetical protein